MCLLESLFGVVDGLVQFLRLIETATCWVVGFQNEAIAVD